MNYQQTVKNASFYFSQLKEISPNSKHILFTVIYQKEKQQISTFGKLELENFVHTCMKNDKQLINYQNS